MADRLTLLRNATLFVELAGLRLLVDPALDAAGARPPVEDTPAARPNPLVELPAAADDALRDLDALIVTHLHRDHFDDAAADRLPKGIPVLCQPPDVESLEERGFRDVRPVDTEARLGDMRVHRTPACHCLDPAIREALGPGSGYVLDAGRARLYVAGDSVWSDPVAAALEEHRPDVVIVNSGAARFLTGPPISMTAEDVIATARARPEARVVAVHLEAINHCLLSRAELARALREAGVDAEVPADGETLMLD